MDVHQEPECFLLFSKLTIAVAESYTTSAVTSFATMKFFSLAIFASLSLTTAVSAWQCLSDADAKQLIDNSVSLLEHPDPEAARKASYADLSPNIVQYSDSINVLYGDPVRCSC